MNCDYKHMAMANRNQRQCSTCNGKGSYLAMDEELYQYYAGTGKDTKSDL